MFNAVLCIVGTAIAAFYWNDPQHQFVCGVNVTLALWCGLDFLKESVPA